LQYFFPLAYLLTYPAHSYHAHHDLLQSKPPPTPRPEVIVLDDLGQFTLVVTWYTVGIGMGWRISLVLDKFADSPGKFANL
jgi:hypothetical protein